MYMRPCRAFHTQIRARPPHETLFFIDAASVPAGLYMQARQCEAIHTQRINIIDVHNALLGLPHADKGPALP